MKSPAFQFYPKDWLSSRRVRMMTAEQRGWYIQLLCEAWDSEVQGTLPNDPKVLWILAGASNEQVFNTCSTGVLSMFKIKGDSLYHERLIHELSKQQHLSELRSRAGTESGKKRRQLLGDKHLTRLNTCSTDVENMLNRPTDIASASASASASAMNIKRGTMSKPTLEEVKVQCRAINQSESQGEAFFNYYESNGWKVGKNPMKVWKASLSGWCLRNNELNSQKQTDGFTPKIKGTAFVKPTV